MSNTLPQPDAISRKDKEDGFGAYIMMFAGVYFPLPFVEMISSFIYYIYFRNRSRYAAFHSYQSLLGQLPVTILNTGFFVYLVVLIVRLFRYDSFEFVDRNQFFLFLGAVVLINIAYIILSLYIAVEAKKGVFIYMPVVGKLAYEKFYGTDAVEISGAPEDKTYKNSPPF